MATLAVLELNPDFRIGQTMGAVEFFSALYGWRRPLRSLARFGPNGSVVPLGDIPTNSIPDRQHHQSGILNAITESRLDGVAMIHFEGRHAPPPPTRARGAAGSVGGAVQVEAVEQVVGVSVALPQRRQAVTGLDHLQDRGGVVERVIHEAAPGER